MSPSRNCTAKVRAIFEICNIFAEKLRKKMRIVGLGNALIDVLLQLKQEEILSEIGIQKGAMDMINREQMIAIRQ